MYVMKRLIDIWNSLARSPVPSQTSVTKNTPIHDQVLPMEAGVREAVALAERLTPKESETAGVETPGNGKGIVNVNAAGARLEPGQYMSLRDALAVAEPGATVVLGSGHYREEVNLAWRMILSEPKQGLWRI